MTHDESDHWQLVYGKRKGEFRGEAIAHRLEQTTHHHSNSITGQLSQHSKTSRPKPPSESLQATSLTTPPYLHSEGSNSQAMLKAVVGMDAHETFSNVTQHAAGGTANTGRGV